MRSRNLHLVVGRSNEKSNEIRPPVLEYKWTNKGSKLESLWPLIVARMGAGRKRAVQGTGASAIRGRRRTSCCLVVPAPIKRARLIRSASTGLERAGNR